MVRKFVLAFLVLLAMIVGLSLYVALTVAPDFFAARRSLAAPLASLRVQDIREAKDHLRTVEEHLGAAPARLLGYVPIVGQNLEVIEAAARTSVPALSSGEELKLALDELQERRIVREGVVQIELFAGLEGLLRHESVALDRLATTLRVHRTGWLLPPVWDAVDGLLDDTVQASQSLDRASKIARIAGPMLGENGPRTYLVMLVNNAEVRGAGGILSGVGILTIDHGRIELGDFAHYKELSGEPPYRLVKVPGDFAKRYGRYDADTSHIVNATMSPDVPDSALVAARAVEATTGTRTDGALMVDPRGVAALLPASTRVQVPGGPKLSPATLPDYTYSDAYEELGGGSERRREAIVGLGEDAFNQVVEGGVQSKNAFEEAATAFAGGHVRVISFASQAEQAVLDEVGASGSLRAPPGDSVMVVAQNFGGDKLDYYAGRVVEHSCIVEQTSQTGCSTTVTLENQVPEGLTRYVYQTKPYGVLKTLLEIYVPAGSRITHVTRDGTPVEFISVKEEGRISVSVYVEVPQGEATELSVGYDIELDDPGYSLVARPQPLSRDARLRVAVEVPPGWELNGPGDLRNGVIRYDDTFAGELHLTAGPDERTGIPRAWASLTSFWRSPVF